MSGLYTITLDGVSEEVYNKATDYIQTHALRLNYRPEVSTVSFRMMWIPPRLLN